MSDVKEVPINPGVKIYGVLRNLKYEPWFAFGEFIDNSIQSFLDHEIILKLNKPDYKLKIEINFEEGCTTISDNAAGIIAEPEYEIENKDYSNKNFIPKSFDDKVSAIKNKIFNNVDLKYTDNTPLTREERWHHAFKLAEQKEEGGLNRFGMGMKTASLWLCGNWTVRTKAIGDNVIREVVWDFDNITSKEKESLIPIEVPTKDYNDSFTHITLRKPTDNMPDHHNTIKRTKDFLKSIYRNYLKRTDIEISVLHLGKKEILKYEDTEILYAPYYKDLNGDKIKWHQEIDLDLGYKQVFINGKYKQVNQRMYGFIGLMSKMSNAKAGFSFFFNNRVIQGAGDKKFIPKFMGSAHSNSHERGRIFGEIHLEGFELTHTKDGFVGNEDFDETFEWGIKEEITLPNSRFMDQAKHFKKSDTPESQRKKSKKAVVDAKSKIKKAVGIGVVSEEPNDILGEVLNQESVEIDILGDEFNFKTQVSLDEKSSSLYTMQWEGSNIDLNINRAHPLFSYSRSQDESLLILMIQSMCLSEINYVESGSENVEQFRVYFEQNLKKILV